MDFIPEESKQEQEVPYFDDVTGDDGWQGHATSKSIEVLKAEISQAISRLGGTVTGFQRGSFRSKRRREGFRVSYLIERENGVVFRGQLDVAALPVKENRSKQRSIPRRRDQSLKMALYMLRNALDGQWFLQQLSPGYAALMPWTLEEKTGKTITQLWSESDFSDRLLPPGDFIEGDFTDVE